ncbi:dihydroxyacetone kinase family protein [Actinomyces faecalis]|uniref:dihydroxyacetone kinase family protein n=1 Tax=Actinomyces faecalis TaxID=2722820 RepID=UPI001551B911|nr:dihydroxyacetone kinase family protein [Actinomyces faecalis]
MTYLKHDPSTFAALAVQSFAQVHADLVQPIDGGVARATRDCEDQVALVIGGGSGHYPAFAGLVGPGLAHGAVLGNIFASPSAGQVEGVARAVEQGRGVLLSYGNYAGDRLQFDAAAARLEAAGTPVRTVRVTDDVSSAPPEEAEWRRGLAGDLVVFKVAGAAAARGDDLETVHALAGRANAVTRTLGVALTGCTLPGAEAPLFTVPEGRMGVGLGIHGEPGLDEVDTPDPAGLAELLVSRLLAEAPGGRARGSRVVALVNGLGAVKMDELYVVWGEIRQALETAGVEVADVQVGEFCTSFEMAGMSLTLAWLDPELEELWRAPARSAEYQVGQSDGGEIAVVRSERREETAAVPRHGEPDLPVASLASQGLAERVADVLRAVSDAVDAQMDELGRIDAIAGDGDHGIGMHNGARAAAASAAELAAAGAGAGTLLVRAGRAWSDGAGGTSGALWDTMLATLGRQLGDQEGADLSSLRQGIQAAYEAVTRQGGAQVGDKTLVDALAPFARVFADAEEPAQAVWRQAAAAAHEGAASTVGMMPGLGRARSHGEKARQVPDPGAVSFALVAETVAQRLGD